jgi:hypothetical protein
MTNPFHLTAEFLNFITETRPHFLDRLASDRNITPEEVIYRVRNRQLLITWEDINSLALT